MGVEMSLLIFGKYRDQAVTRCQGQRFSQGKFTLQFTLKVQFGLKSPDSFESQFFFSTSQVYFDIIQKVKKRDLNLENRGVSLTCPC